MDSITHKFLILMKFGSYHHLEQFRNSGHIYMNSENYFRELEGDLVRQDKYEGIDRFYQSKSIKSLTIGKPGKKQIVLDSENLVGPLTIRFPRYSRNLFCLFSITDPRKLPIVDERNFLFGDSVIIIKNTQAFIDLVVARGEKAGLDVNCCLVEYFDPASYSGNVGPCKKSNIYSYQNEFRFIVNPGSNEPLILDVGSIVDISTEIFPLNEINSALKFNYEESDVP